MTRKLVVALAVCLILLIVSAVPLAARERFSFGFSFGGPVAPYNYYGYYPRVYAPTWPAYGYYYYQPYSSYYYSPYYVPPAAYYYSPYPYRTYRVVPRAYDRRYTPRRYYRRW